MVLSRHRHPLAQPSVRMLVAWSSETRHVCHGDEVAVVTPRESNLQD
jgi:hypothetical protein